MSIFYTLSVFKCILVSPLSLGFEIFTVNLKCFVSIGVLIQRTCTWFKIYHAQCESCNYSTIIIIVNSFLVFIKCFSFVTATFAFVWCSQCFGLPTSDPTNSNCSVFLLFIYLLMSSMRVVSPCVIIFTYYFCMHCFHIVFSGPYDWFLSLHPQKICNMHVSFNFDAIPN